jgi:hypothetical protein
MRNLIFLFHEIQLFPDRWIIFIAILSYLEQDLNHVLNALIDVGLMQNAAELIEYGKSDWCAHLL